MPPTIPADLTERLSSWRQISGQSQNVAVRQLQRVKALEAHLWQIAKITLWLVGLGACFMLAWRASDQSILLTSLTLVLPLLAWFLFRLWPWALLLPFSLMALLALQGAILMW
jgi:hypothetical protein